jgi:hypothetical protein
MMVADGIFTSPAHMLQGAKHKSMSHIHGPLNVFSENQENIPTRNAYHEAQIFFQVSSVFL